MEKCVYICSPYRVISSDPVQRAWDKLFNILTARLACREAVRQGCIPIAPHLYAPQFLRDEAPAERRIGVEMGMKAMEDCDELWVIGDHISDGMADEIAKAKEIEIPIRCVQDLPYEDAGLLLEDFLDAGMLAIVNMVLEAEDESEFGGERYADQSPRT